MKVIILLLFILTVSSIYVPTNQIPPFCNQTFWKKKQYIEFPVSAQKEILHKHCLFPAYEVVFERNPNKSIEETFNFTRVGVGRILVKEYRDINSSSFFPPDDNPIYFFDFDKNHPYYRPYYVDFLYYNGLDYTHPFYQPKIDSERFWKAFTNFPDININHYEFGFSFFEYLNKPTTWLKDRKGSNHYVAFLESSYHIGDLEFGRYYLLEDLIKTNNFPVEIREKGPLYGVDGEVLIG